MRVPWPSEAVEWNEKKRNARQSAQITFTDDQLACDPQNRMQDHTHRDIYRCHTYRYIYRFHTYTYTQAQYHLLYSKSQF